MSLFIFIIILVSYIFLGALVYYKNPRGKENKIFLWLVIFIMIWSLANYLENEKFSDHVKIIFFYIDFSIGLAVGYLWFIFCFIFLENKEILKPQNNLLAVITSFFIVLILFTDQIIKNVYIQGTIIKFQQGNLFFLFAFFVIFCFIGGSVSLALKCRRFESQKRLQTLYVLFGFILTSTIVVTMSLFFQEKVSVEIYQFSSFSVIFLIIFTGLAIYRHHLFDIRALIQRGVIYSALASLIVVGYLIILNIFIYFFQQRTNVTYFVSAGVVSLIGIFVAPLIERWFRKKTDRIFFKDKYDYSEAMYELSETLNRNIELGVLLINFGAKLKSILKVEKVNIIIPGKNLVSDATHNLGAMPEKIPPSVIRAIEEEGEPLLLHSDIPDLIAKAEANHRGEPYIEALKQAENFGQKYGLAATVAVMLGGKLEGLITLGEKMSGDPFSAEDIKLLKTLAYQAAVALEKARLFEQVKDYSTQLEKKVEKRTSEIRSLQEGQRQMMLEIAHGLQTPLTIIKGEISLMQKANENAKMFDTLEKSIDRISKFIYDMLRLARLENRKNDNLSQEVNLSELIQELAESFIIITEEKNIKIVPMIEPNIKILGEKGELEELIMNLVSNSVKYMDPERAKVIHLSLSGRNKEAVIEIEDTGLGIKMQFLPRIFERFFRIKDENYQSRKGTGLGLAIAKEIVERHKGRIKVESQVNVGTKFTIYFPILK